MDDFICLYTLVVKQQEILQWPDFRVAAYKLLHMD